jgi:hypothetical protein
LPRKGKLDCFASLAMTADRYGLAFSAGQDILNAGSKPSSRIAFALDTTSQFSAIL